MASYLLDTTVIVNYLRGKPATVRLVKRIFAEGSSLGCCPINIIEVCAGALEKEKEATRQFLDSLEYYELTKETAMMAGEYKRYYQKKGTTLSLPDVAIAAVAIANDLTLLTDNRKHYPMTELNVQAANG